ncbi:hypothetical protein B0H13DRAFT_816277 [Mycena leptocephala]|nr:hypothetical protein B0H13DRAFT_816277 [Mycena leptocephala]
MPNHTQHVSVLSLLFSHPTALPSTSFRRRRRRPPRILGRQALHKETPPRCRSPGISSLSESCLLARLRRYDSCFKHTKRTLVDSSPPQISNLRPHSPVDKTTSRRRPSQKRHTLRGFWRTNPCALFVLAMLNTVEELTLSEPPTYIPNGNHSWHQRTHRVPHSLRK